MSVEQRISTGATPFETSNRFQATFNAAGTGLYEFAFDGTQQNALVLPLNQNYVYLIERVSYSVSMDEGVYLGAVTTPLPEFRLRFGANQLIAFANPIRGVIYHDAMEHNFWVWTDKGSDTLTVSMVGTLNQTAPLIGTPQIFAYLSLVIYQEANRDIVDAVKARTAPGAGRRFYESVA